MVTVKLNFNSQRFPSSLVFQKRDLHKMLNWKLSPTCGWLSSLTYLFCTHRSKCQRLTKPCCSSSESHICRSTCTYFQLRRNKNGLWAALLLFLRTILSSNTGRAETLLLWVENGGGVSQQRLVVIRTHNKKRCTLYSRYNGDTSQLIDQPYGYGNKTRMAGAVCVVPCVRACPLHGNCVMMIIGAHS